MSSQGLGEKPAAKLSDLPSDVQYHILDHLAPTQLASYAQLNRSCAALIENPTLWTSVAHRHLNTVPENPTSKAVHKLAQSLVCRWWILTGMFVLNVPVHRRSGFCDISARGGVEIPIIPHKAPTCYVFGGRHEGAAVPVVVPAVSLCFFLETEGPFPVNGMRLALTHAVENEIDDVPDLAHLSLGPSAAVGEQTEQTSSSAESLFASVRVKVNNQTLLSSCSPQSDIFQVTHVHVPADILVTKPRMNHISIEYDRSSTAAYWLKSISIMPTVLPPPAEEKEASSLRIGEEIENPSSETPAPETETPQSRGSPQSNRRSTAERRHARRQADIAFQQCLADQQAIVRHNKGLVITNLKPKHMYHHNYFRSPRRSSPSSPKYSRSGR